MNSVIKALAFTSVLILAIVALAYATSSGGLGVLPPESLRPLAITYLRTVYNPENPKFTAMAPEAVTAILWDYRGLDTLFETVVFYGAIIAVLTLYRETYRERDILPLKGLSIVVKRATAVTSLAILSVAVATALHGHLTPGGGFQAGAIAAVAPLVMLIVFSKRFLSDRLSHVQLLTMRNLGLLGLGLTAIALAIVGFAIGEKAFIFQNQAKEMSKLSFPQRILGVPAGGTLLFFNIFEALAVAAGFTLVFMVLLSSEELSRKEIVGEEHGY